MAQLSVPPQKRRSGTSGRGRTAPTPPFVVNDKSGIFGTRWRQTQTSPSSW